MMEHAPRAPCAVDDASRERRLGARLKVLEFGPRRGEDRSVEEDQTRGPRRGHTIVNHTDSTWTQSRTADQSTMTLWLAGINQSQPLTHMYPPSRSGCIASQRTSPIQDRWRHPLASTPKIQSCFVGLWLPTPTLAPYCSGGDGGGDGTRGGLCSGKAPALLSSAMTDAIDGVASITHVGSDVL